MPIEALADYKGMIMGSIVEGQLVKDVFGWTQKQAYIALGFMLFAAALENVDACPMEGFIAAQVDELVGTHPDYQTVTLLPLGHRDADDAFSQYKKVRWPHQEIIIK
jgi:nitroreductase